LVSALNVEAIASRQEEIGGSGWQHPLSRDCQTIKDHVTRWGFAEPHRVFYALVRVVFRARIMPCSMRTANRSAGMSGGLVFSTENATL